MAVTLRSTFCPKWLTKRYKTFSTKTLIAALCVLALLGTHAVHLTLIHICFQKQNKTRNERVDYRKALMVGHYMDQDLYLHTCVFPSLWACTQTCTSKVRLLQSGLYNCVHRCCHCMCARCRGLRREYHNILLTVKQALNQSGGSG